MAEEAGPGHAPPNTGLAPGERVRIADRMPVAARGRKGQQRGGETDLRSGGTGAGIAWAGDGGHLPVRCTVASGHLPVPNLAAIAWQAAIMALGQSTFTRRASKALAIVIAGVVLLAAAGLARFAQVHVFAHRDRVAALLAGQANPPPRVVDVVMTVEGTYATSWAARSLVAEMRDRPMPTLERHLAGALWWVWLSGTLEDAEIAALYAHFLPFEGGTGLAYGAQHYFAKSPADMTVEEVLGLIAIGRAPARYSPRRAPERHRQEVERLRFLYRGTVEKSRDQSGAVRSAVSCGRLARSGHMSYSTRPSRSCTKNTQTLPSAANSYARKPRASICATLAA